MRTIQSKLKKILDMPLHDREAPLRQLAKELGCSLSATYVGEHHKEDEIVRRIHEAVHNKRESSLWLLALLSAIASAISAVAAWIAVYGGLQSERIPRRRRDPLLVQRTRIRVPQRIRRGACLMDPRVTELHSIMPMENIDSVMTCGILSYEGAARLPHRSVAMQPVQDRRDQKQVPGGLRLHQYANLYFHARNPMLFKRLNEAGALCVLRVSTEVLALDGTVISDQNAASDYVRFLAPSQWPMLNFDDIYAIDWRHQGDRARFFQHRSRKCAEVLVPHRVESHFLMGAYVNDIETKQQLLELGFGLPIHVNPVLFFAEVGG